MLCLIGVANTNPGVPMRVVALRRALKKTAAEDVLAALEAEGVRLRYYPTSGGVEAELPSGYRDVVFASGGGGAAVMDALVDVLCVMLGKAFAVACRPFVEKAVDVWGAALLALLSKRANAGGV